MVRVGHVETKRLLARDNDPARPVPVPVPDVTFKTHHTLHVGGERIDLAWHGSNHSPDNIYIHLPDHDTLMLVDINLPGWAPFDSFNINENVQGSIAAADRAMAYPWKHFIGGHMGRLGNRDDMAIYQQYVTDLVDNLTEALTAVDPTPFFTRYGNNAWAAVQAYQAAQIDYAAAPVIEKYTGVLAAVDVYTASTAFHLLESIRLDLGLDTRIPRDGSRSGRIAGQGDRRVRIPRPLCSPPAPAATSSRADLTGAERLPERAFAGMARARIELATPRFSVVCSTN